MKKSGTIIPLIILLFTMAGCNEWLDVDASENKEAGKFFESEQGFQGATIGLYLKMKANNGYGENLSMGFVEHLAQHWSPKNETTLGYYASHFLYQAEAVENVLQNTFLHLYNIIAEANMILQYIDERRGVFSDPRTADLIKGEALGIRAWCHFDILRLWGPIPSETNGGKILTYSTEFSRENTPKIPFNAYMEHLMADIDSAAMLLKPIDPITMNSLTFAYDGAGGTGFVDNLFWKFRQTKMNYYAVRGMKARVALWNGDKTTALEAAREIIDHGPYTLAGVPVFQSQIDRTLADEHIFALEVYNLETLAIARFRNSGEGNLQKDKEQLNTYFEAGDMRFIYLWSDLLTTSNPPATIFSTRKYLPADEMSNRQKNKIPLMRLSEMYLIAIECGDEEAQQLYDSFCASRGITSKELLLYPVSELMLEQYNKELYAEGQMFFAYKRLGSKSMVWKEAEFDPKEVYVLPQPLHEQIYN